MSHRAGLGRILSCHTDGLLGLLPKLFGQNLSSIHLAELRDEWLHTCVLTEVRLERGNGFFTVALHSPFLHFFPKSGY